MRLIYIPQFPTPMRYQSWWMYELSLQFKMRFDSIVVLGSKYIKKLKKKHGLDKGNIKWFSPVEQAINFEAAQIKEYLQLELSNDDILFHADLSYPGLFHNVLYHKRPNKCFVYCHATSKNKFDYFDPVRPSKFKVETGFSLLYDKVFVGSKYHADKLKWNNIEVVSLPDPPVLSPYNVERDKFIVSVCRPSIQKVNRKLEDRVKKRYGVIHRPNDIKSWDDYSKFLSSSKILLISSREDTFNYTILDAVKLGCIPIAPNSLCFPEILPKEYLYDSAESLFEIVRKIYKGELGVPNILCQELVNRFYDNVCSIMKGDTK